MLRLQLTPHQNKAVVALMSAGRPQRLSQPFQPAVKTIGLLTPDFARIHRPRNLILDPLVAAIASPVDALNEARTTKAPLQCIPHFVNTTVA